MPFRRLDGGAVRNLVVRDLYNRFRGTQWVIAYEMPRLESAYLYSRVTGQRFYPEYDPGNNLVTDFGLIAWVPTRGRSSWPTAGP